MKRRLLVLFSSLCYMLPLIHSIGVWGGEAVSHAADSICLHPLLLYFRFDRSLVEYDYMDNPRTLHEFHALFSDSLSASCIDTITITSYASPEGAARYNSRLAHRRAVAVKGYLLWKYPHLDQYRIVVRPQGEDWTGLRQLVEADTSVPDREDVLQILEEIPDTERCKILLRRLNCGYAYTYINKNLLPKLRNAAVCMMKMKDRAAQRMWASRDSLLRVDESSQLAGCGGEESFARVHSPSASSLASPFVPGAFRRVRPLVSLKTNLLSWAGLASDGKVTSFRPNIALELFFARRWSLSASGEYACWRGGTDRKFWGISGYSLEPRLWLLGDGTYRFLYVGAYGRLGDFDYQPHPDGDAGRMGASATGTCWSAGLSLGLHLRLSRHWGLEAGLRGGYRNASGKAYDNEPPHAYYHHDLSSGRWGVTGLDFSVTYRWWNKTRR
ncbi:DUF3575 domain-containing protein [Bacteroides timonensis]|uniref:DUF3575 domain-containing protein n=1 Tax=Bacteroides timonensis TaxID=1470345 RepID=UPI0005C6A14C|nr:DUF3575 domain-containing protein [Bacteroides timonensis]